jgi:very-short-patch-repair endonuclease
MYKKQVSIYEIAKILRKKTTLAEQTLWDALKNRDLKVKFRRQEPFVIGRYRYVADFCSHKNKLIIEIDGSVHDSEDAKGYDEFRQEIFIEHGYRIIRFTNDEILNDLGMAVEKIKEIVKK